MWHFALDELKANLFAVEAALLGPMKQRCFLKGIVPFKEATTQTFNPVASNTVWSLTITSEEPVLEHVESAAQRELHERNEHNKRVRPMPCERPKVVVEANHPQGTKMIDSMIVLEFEDIP